ncbi:hypothetical protein [Desulfosediminicola sp.]|uniref:hypothetical protein n=1 Tax=Desulfosediminicola sp. TaxID=2886825 RepID=UPI003AF2F665
MKKTILALTGLAIFSFMIASSANASSVSGSDGAAVTITATSVTGATSLVFQPSAKVNMNGATAATAFGINAWHTGSAGKEKGQRYAMASDSSQIFWQDISSTGTPGAVAGTNASAYSNWNTM